MSVKKSHTFFKWVLYVLLGLLVFCMQSAPIRLGIFEDVIYILPFVVAVACFEGLGASVSLGVTLGFIWDYIAQRQFGFHALLLCVLCTAVFLAMKFYVRPVYLSVVVAIGVCTLVYLIFDFFFFFVLRGYESLGALLLSQYLPSLLKTTLFGAAISFVIMKIYSLSPIKARFDV